MAAWPEALMCFFECGFRECSRDFSPGQGYHWCERNFGRGVKGGVWVCVCVSGKILTKMLSF